MKEVPTFEHWNELALVVRHVELLIEDAPLPDHSNPGGLLMWASYDPPLPPNAGKFFKELHYPSVAGSLRTSDVKRIVELLPGIELAGASRTERLFHLGARLPELTAYRWLKAQEGYRSALETLEKKSRKSVVSVAGSYATTRLGQVVEAAHVHSVGYGKDTRQFLLLEAVIWPIQNYQMYSSIGLQPPFPTKEQIESAAKCTGDLLTFLHDCYAVRELVNIPLRFKQDLEQVSKALGEIAPDYTKPRVDATFNERRYTGEVIENCGRAFGDCSPVLIRSLLDVIKFNYDEASLKQRIAEWRRQQRTMESGGGLAGLK